VDLNLNQSTVLGQLVAATMHAAKAAG
jgi:hypothetical protein